MTKSSFIPVMDNDYYTFLTNEEFVKIITFIPEHWTLGTKGETLVFMRVCGVAVHFCLL